MDIYHAILKEWYWIVIVGAIVSMAFTPTFLKGKCPKCKKRALKTVDVEQDVRELLQEKENRAFLTFFRCEHCDARQMRELTGAFEDAQDDRWAAAFEPNLTKTIELTVR
jgi:hypothetical protein